VQLSEFGIGLSGSISSVDRNYLNCVVGYATSNDMDWAYWALQGSYYVRDANADVDESFGLLKKDWSDWRNTEFKGLLGNMWQQTQGP
jgi:endoglucanase